MKINSLLWPVLAAGILTGSLSAQQGTDASTGSAETTPAETARALKELEAFQSKLNKLDFKTGKIDLPGGIASLDLPDGWRYLSPADARTVLVDIYGNPPAAGSNTKGMIFPKGQEVTGDNSWSVVLQFEEDGYVSDEDADDIDYDDLLKTMKEGSAKASAERVRGGYGKMLLKGWALPPRYDKKLKVMYWAQEFITDDLEGTLNYDVRVLGRRGVLSLIVLGKASQAQELDTHTGELVALASFNPGHRYQDFNESTDKKADYSLAGLVLGGAVAAKVLAKGGILVLLAKFGKLLIIPVVVVIAWLKRKFSRS